MSLGKRKRIDERIDDIIAVGEGAVFDLSQELRQEDEQYTGLRWHAKATQASQDRLLASYRRFISMTVGTSHSDVTEAAIDELCFPRNHPDLFVQARRFMIFMIANATPRSREDAHICYATACHYRNHFMFWAKRKYDERDTPSPRPARLFNELTEAIRGAAIKRSICKATTSKAFIGLPEIQFMIDLDMRSTPSVEVAEQHHLAWCIGRCTALRPSSFGPKQPAERPPPGPNGYEDFMMWQDVRITRVPGRTAAFAVNLKVRNLKSRSDADALLDRQKGNVQPQTLAFNILSPQNKENIPFSVPHRLLVIALRRQVLEGVSNLEELFSGDQAQLTVKKEFLRQPIFFAATPRGLALDDTKPMPASALTQYIQVRGYDAGFPDRLTFYSIRRRVATDLAAAFGNDAAREILGHMPISKTLEVSYLEFNAMRHTTALGLGEDTAGQQEELRSQLHQQLLRRLNENMVEKSRGEALNTLVQETLDADQEFAELNGPQEIRNYMKRTRRLCFQAFWKELHVEADRILTLEEAQQRQDELLSQASTFAERVLAAVTERMSTVTSSVDPELDNLVQQQGLSFDAAFPEDQTSTQPEDDVEERDVGPDSELDAFFDGDIEHDAVFDDEPQQVKKQTWDESTYAQIAHTFMEVLITNSVSEYTPNEMVKCPLCAEDPTIPDEQKHHERSIDHHKVHIKRLLHSGFERFRREVQAAAEARDDGRIFCPYCVKSLPEDSNEQPTSFSKNGFRRLIQHVEQSDADVIHGAGVWKLDDAATRRHEDLKWAAGWYEDGFKGDQEARAESRAKERKSMAKAADAKWSNDAELPTGVAVEGRTGLVRGGPGVTTSDFASAFSTMFAVAPDHYDDGPTTDGLLATFPDQLTEEDSTWSTNDILGRFPGFATDKRPTRADHADAT